MANQPPNIPADRPDQRKRARRRFIRQALFLLILLPLAVLANMSIWQAANPAHDTKGWSGEIVGLSFSPFRPGQNPDRGRFPTAEQIDEDLALLSSVATAVRTYSVTNGFENIPELARLHGLSVAPGAWLGPNREINRREVENLKQIAFDRNVVRVMVGNEAILRGDLTVDEVIAYLRDVKKTVWKPVSTAEPWDVWLKNPELVEEVDYIAAHILPYWEGVPVEHAVDFVFDRISELKAAYPDKPIVVAEVGWPSNGKTIPRIPYEGMPEAERDWEAVPSLVNEARFLREYLNRAHAAGLTYYVIEAFDQPWKGSGANEGAVGSYWGVYNADREPKFPMTGLVSEVPHWRLWASLAVGLAFLPAVLFMLRRHHIGIPGMVLFLGMTQLFGTTIAWALLTAADLYLTPTGIVIWGFLIGAQGILLLVLLTEAVELVEVIWTREGHRHFQPFAADASGYTPKVSVHIPIHNEPPEMVEETLRALARLDYPTFEVIVMDNNTADPEVWRPVEAFCASLDARFRFLHVEGLAGFKAGALNYARAQTAADAEIIAVIDSDYQVSPDWLKSLIPYFGKDDVAFVQAPQDYRDRKESLFKECCYWEYAGFFHIGMVQRNNFNAIIQHGTMTMVRKSALDEVGGWSEWCICEDAELGIKLYKANYDSVYVNRSFGQGLTPDTLAAYIGQRFRWAYGAVQILKHHWRSFLPGGRKRLSPAQRYYFVAGWFPWLADGVALVFTLASLFLSVWILLEPNAFALPVAAFLIPTLGSFVFKISRSFWLYTVRVGSTFRETMGGALAALALTHTVAKAVLQGVVTRDKPFFRTPKCEAEPGLKSAFVQAREETLMAVSLWVVAGFFLFDPQFQDTNSRLWVAVLFTQSVPYASAIILSLINVAPNLFRRGNQKPSEAAESEKERYRTAD